MSKTLRVSFNIFLNDSFMENVMRYAERDSIEDVTGEDIVWFLNDFIEPATSTHESFEIEGGDTDGWFVQGFEE